MSAQVRLIEVEQGTPEWHLERAGVITGSMMGEVQKVVGGLNEQQQKYYDAIKAGMKEKEAATAAGYKAVPRAAVIEKALDGEEVGDFSDAAKSYAYGLAIERISGMPLDEGFENYWTRRGHEMEIEARRDHSMRLPSGVKVIPAGFLKTIDGKFGASADGFIREDGGAEYKAFVDAKKIREILLNRDISEFIPQCQAGLWLSGRRWWDFGLYCPALEAVGRQLTIRRVWRDEDYIEAMEQRALKFDALVEEYRTGLLDSDDDDPGPLPELKTETEPTAAGIFGGGA